MKYIICSLILFSNFSFGQFKTSSVLSTGQWYKIGITSDGIYRIDASYLSSLGIDVSKLDANTIQIYGNGNGMLPQPISEKRIDDLAEIPTYKSGFSDSKLDPSDFLLFYANGADSWKYSKSAGYLFEKNIYCDSSYYFLTVGQSISKTIELPSPINSAGVAVNAYDALISYEKDQVNFLKSGREWFGDQIDPNSGLNLSFNTTDIVPNSNIEFKLSVAIKSDGGANPSFSFKCNEREAASFVSNGCYCGSYLNKGVQTDQTVVQNATLYNNAEKLNYTINFNNAENKGALAYLNYINTIYQRKIKLSSSPIIMHSSASLQNEISTFQIENGSASMQIWDVTNLHEAKSIGSINNSFSILTKDTLRKLVLFEPSLISQKPSFVGKVSNQNIHGCAEAKLIIVSHPSLLSEANRLADFKRSIGMSTIVVSTSEVFNEFSSGAQDITAIRDMVRMMWKTKKSDYLLLFGACSYDFKYRIKDNTNLVPTYESRESFHEVNSYSSDDYFGLVGDNQGFWSEFSQDNSDIKIGIGRIPARNLSDATNAVEKIIHYSSSPQTFGHWRNKMVYLCDNGDGNSHFGDAERLAMKIDSTQKVYNINKIYLDAYPLISTPSGNASPQVRERIRSAINQGALIVNYSGHGGPEQLTQEKIIELSDIPKWNNFDNLPFFVTATCDFGVYDDPERVSGGVNMITANKSGGIGVLTAGRPVYQNTNFLLNAQFYSYAFQADSSGVMPSIGTVIRKTKNSSIRGVNNRSYSLLGDPSLTLNYPKYRLVITSINGQNINALTDTLKALSLVTMNGEVQQFGSANRHTSFKGILSSDIFDKYDSISTIGQGSEPAKYRIRNNIVHAGQSSIKNGQFSFQFILPKDINYQTGNGKISLYARPENGIEDGNGYNLDFLIGGTNANANEDTTPPEIALFIDDTTFINGGYAQKEPTLIVKLSDQNGINLARSGIGHEITGRFQNDAAEDLILNDYYISELDNYQKGSIHFKLGQLPEGSHRIKVKAWDTYNNSSEKSIDFIIASSNKLAIQELFNFPNPVSDFTTFRIQHNRAGEDLDLILTISDLNGRVIKKYQRLLPMSDATIDLGWNAEELSNITQGTYVYECTLRSKLDQTSDQKIRKLVLIR